MKTGLPQQTGLCFAPNCIFVHMKSFASDNYAGAVTEVISAIGEANSLHARSYGEDNWNKMLKTELERLFNKELNVFLTFNGTGANVLGLGMLAEPYAAVICSDVAHIYVDESTAPEAFTGCRLMPVKANDQGKVEVDSVSEKLERIGDKHHPQVQVISLTQPTEYGTLYTLEELKAIGTFAKNNGLLVHMDGSRMLLGSVASGQNLAEIIEAAQVDVLSLGGTKAGMLYGEAVLVFNEALYKKAPFHHKRSMQLASKNRFIAAQFLALLKDDCYRGYAEQTLERTRQLKSVLEAYPQIRITKPVEANAVFAVLPEDWIAPLQEKFPFYKWREESGEVRLMCSFDTTIEDIEGFREVLASLS